MPTIFSKIIAREIPAHIVYEDELVIAFLDISQATKGHTLVVPKADARRSKSIEGDQHRFPARRHEHPFQ